MDKATLIAVCALSVLTACSDAPSEAQIQAQAKYCREHHEASLILRNAQRARVLCIVDTTTDPWTLRDAPTMPEEEK